MAIMPEEYLEADWNIAYQWKLRIVAQLGTFSETELAESSGATLIQTKFLLGDASLPEMSLETMLEVQQDFQQNFPTVI